MTLRNVQPAEEDRLLDEHVLALGGAVDLLELVTWLDVLDIKLAVHPESGAPCNTSDA